VNRKKRRRKAEVVRRVEQVSVREWNHERIRGLVQQLQALAAQLCPDQKRGMRRQLDEIQLTSQSIRKLLMPLPPAVKRSKAEHLPPRPKASRILKPTGMKKPGSHADGKHGR